MRQLSDHQQGTRNHAIRGDAAVRTSVYSSSANIQSAVNGFAVSGLWPFDDTKFDAEVGGLEMPMLQPVSVSRQH